MKTATIIPARGGSKGLPKKNILPFCGIPLIGWSIRQAKACPTMHQVYVSTDDDEIAEISAGFGAEIIKRPDSLATDECGTEPVLVHAISEIQKDVAIDTVVFLQATSPVRKTDDIERALHLFAEEKRDCLFSGSLVTDFCFWTEDIPGAFKSLNFDAAKRGRRQDKKPLYLENGSLYIFNVQKFLKMNNRFCGSASFFEMPIWQSFEIDSREEFDFLQTIMKEKIL